jgi:hypothetical protein
MVLRSFSSNQHIYINTSMTEMKSWKSVHRLFAFLYHLLASVAISSEINCRVSIVNHSGVNFEVYWVHPITREEILLTPPNVGVRNGASEPFDSFVGHEFEIREMPAAETGECRNENSVCHSANFIVSESGHQCESDAHCYGRLWSLVHQQDARCCWITFRTRPGHEMVT